MILFPKVSPSNSSCSTCSLNSCYQCYNTLPTNRTHIEKLTIICNQTTDLFQHSKEQVHSILQSFTTINCTMKTLYIDHYTHWNYLNSLAIIYANLTHLSLSSSYPSLSILSNVKTLNLSYNSIRILNRNFSFCFPSLEKLDLSYNRLILIKTRTFVNLIYLKELYLNNNYLKQIFPNILPRQSLSFINLNKNHWYCSCTNVLRLEASQPIPNCYSPKEFQNQNASLVAQQCFLRSKANLLITTDENHEQNLTCILSTVADAWLSKVNTNLTILAIWNIERHHAISTFSINRSHEYFVCFNSSSTHSESIHTIIPLPFTKLNSLITSSTTHTLSPFFLWLLNASKNILPKSFRTSDKQILVVWLILLCIAFGIFIFLIYFIYRHRTLDKYYLRKSYSLIRLDSDSSPTLPQHRTLFNANCACKNHKCLCQYRRRVHSKSSSLLKKQIYSMQPLFIEPSELRYAKVKRISSAKETINDYSTGEFRTVIKMKSLPS
ncbi:unnamed protein product [Adineta ricciae]|uniref:Uncharacterized protein n=1 Tax=Adineta ricciae TaxID=249248 RepID=A0A814BCJ6_ADIRI|nr:unnamed protein product [Adineta ricciae]CAF1014902.1 unnamed protein product [Adineta ricciae]